MVAAAPPISTYANLLPVTTLNPLASSRWSVSAVPDDHQICLSPYPQLDLMFQLISKFKGIWYNNKKLVPYFISSSMAENFLVP
jgi:hypothetical protein